MQNSSKKATIASHSENLVRILNESKDRKISRLGALKALGIPKTRTALGRLSEVIDRLEAEKKVQKLRGHSVRLLPQNNSANDQTFQAQLLHALEGAEFQKLSRVGALKAMGVRKSRATLDKLAATIDALQLEDIVEKIGNHSICLFGDSKRKPEDPIPERQKQRHKFVDEPVLTLFDTRNTDESGRHVEAKNENELKQKNKQTMKVGEILNLKNKWQSDGELLVEEVGPESLVLSYLEPESFEQLLRTKNPNRNLSGIVQLELQQQIWNMLKIDTAAKAKEIEKVFEENQKGVDQAIEQGQLFKNDISIFRYAKKTDDQKSDPEPEQEPNQKGPYNFAKELQKLSREILELQRELVAIGQQAENLRTVKFVELHFPPRDKQTLTIPANQLVKVPAVNHVEMGGYYAEINRWRYDHPDNFSLSKTELESDKQHSFDKHPEVNFVEKRSQPTTVVMEFVEEQPPNPNHPLRYIWKKYEGTLNSKVFGLDHQHGPYKFTSEVLGECSVSLTDKDEVVLRVALKGKDRSKFEDRIV